MPPPQPRAPPALPDVLVEEVLLRVPPDDPASLARAALTCPRWQAPQAARRHAAHAGRHVRRRMGRRRGPTSPRRHLDNGQRPFARFVPTSSFVPPRADHRDWLLSDVRHGRVLLYGTEREHHLFASEAAEATGFPRKP
ncbi:unnamed protein product [Urochloa humidicola]